jgi:AraC-like DNA-binding protein
MESGYLILETALFAIGFFCTALSSIVLLSYKDGRSPANRFLVTFLGIMSLALFMNFMILSKFILQFPWLYRLPSPLFYFLVPSAYIYVRMVLLDEPHARKTDWLHAIPALIHLLEMLPFYLGSNEIKIAQIIEDSQNPMGLMANTEGWLPVYIHNLLRGIQGLIYTSLIYLMLWKSAKKRSTGRIIFPEMIQWLWVFVTMILILSIAFILAFTIPGINIATKSFLLYFIMTGTQIVSGIYLLFNPSILFGMPKLEKMVAKLRQFNNGILYEQTTSGNTNTANRDESGIALSKNLQSDKNITVEFELEPANSMESQPGKMSIENIQLQKNPQVQYDNYIHLLTRLMEDKKPFLRKRYSISDLSKDANIPQHHISYLLNNIFQIRFNEYINQFRIKYIKDRVAHEEIGHLTMEGLALEAGFNSRITFIRVVKKHTGMNPSEYYKVDLFENDEKAQL